MRKPEAVGKIPYFCLALRTQRRAVGPTSSALGRGYMRSVKNFKLDCYHSITNTRQRLFISPGHEFFYIKLVPVSIPCAGLFGYHFLHFCVIMNCFTVITVCLYYRHYAVDLKVTMPD